MILPHMKSGIRRNLILVISGSGDVLLMFMFNRINVPAQALIWTNVSLLGILKVTRVGSFTILKPKRSLSANVLTLMNGIPMMEHLYRQKIIMFQNQIIKS